LHWRRAFQVATLAVLAGCGHGDAFQAATPHPSGPLVPGPVARLTYSIGRDRSSSWSPQGIVYTNENVVSVVRGWCLGVLPDSGGSRTHLWCDTPPDSQVAYDWAAESPGGRLAYVRAAGLPLSISPGWWWVMVSDDGEPRHGVPLVPVVLTPPGGPPLQSVEQLRWLDSTRLVWVGDHAFFGAPCRGCPIDTIASGRILLTMDTRGDTLPTVLAGTDYATSVAVRGNDEIFYTRGGDARVFRRVVSTGVTTVVWDFTASGIVRDVQVAGDRLVAIIGGAVSFAYDGTFGDSLQSDAGGDLVVADLATGAEQRLSLPFPVRHPALSADGRHVVVETALAPEDLYLVALP
jgi:hypothetical protein